MTERTETEIRQVRQSKGLSIYRLTPPGLVIAACGALVASHWIAQATGVTGYGWDIDHMMYFGQRLLAGEFHWTAEFDDKLPVVQFLFALPAYTGSVLGWLFLSTAFVALGACACFFLVNDVLSDDPAIAPTNRRQVSAFAALATVYLFAALPGGFYQINPAAASAAAVAIALLVKAVPVQGPSLVAPFLLATLAASLSIGIRPYFLLPLIAAGLLMLTRRSRPWLGREGVLVLAGLWVAGIGVSGLLVNALPYLLLGEIEAFLAGMAMLSQELNPQGIASTIWDIVRTINGSNLLIVGLICASVAAAILSVSLLVRPDMALPAADQSLYGMLILTMIVPLLLLLSILTKHYWSHYLQMFAPFMGMGAAFLAALWMCGAQNARTQWHVGHWALSISIVLISILPYLALDVAMALQAARQDRTADRLAMVNAVQTTQSASRRDFLFLDDMRTHWALAEPRHGFPHAANTVHVVINGWWRSVDMPDWFAHPINAEEYCVALEAEGPSLVFVGAKLSSFDESCLRKSKTYKFEKEFEEEQGFVKVFSRR